MLTAGLDEAIRLAVSSSTGQQVKATVKATLKRRIAKLMVFSWLKIVSSGDEGSITQNPTK